MTHNGVYDSPGFLQHILLLLTSCSFPHTDMPCVQALVEGTLAQPQLPDVSSPRHSHLQRLVHQISQESDDCQARLSQLQACYCHFLAVLSFLLSLFFLSLFLNCPLFKLSLVHNVPFPLSQQFWVMR